MANCLLANDVALGEMSPLHQLFAILPLQHSEDLQDHAVALLHMERLMATVRGSELEAYAGACIDAAVAHRDTITRFGRFPHRNNALAREGTEEELGFLEAGGHRWGQ